MLSDFRIFDEALNKHYCVECGMIQRACAQSERHIFNEDYELYAHAPGGNEETARQRLYASWLLEIHPFESVFEAGAGNGSLLLEMVSLRKGLRAGGIEPAQSAASQARAAGVNVATGFLVSAQSCSHDIAIAVNVIEHVSDPVDFLRMLGTYSAGRIAVVCPNGSSPSTELLISDHLHSFTPAHMRGLFARAGYEVQMQQNAPAALGPFFVTVGVERAFVSSDRVARNQTFAHADYLRQWSDLDIELCRRLGQTTRVAAFGAGETAALLRVYAPETWQRIEYCITDSPEFKSFADRPLTAYISGCAHTVLLATKPSAQPRLAARVVRDGYNVVRWDDLIAA